MQCRQCAPKHNFEDSCDKVEIGVAIIWASARNGEWPRASIALPRVRTMCSLRRNSVVLSLVAYLFATTAIDALHNHSAGDPCCSDGDAICAVGDAEHSCGLHTHDGDSALAANGSAHSGFPARSHDHERNCFACRFLAAKAIVSVAVAVVERTEVLHQVEQQQPLFAPTIRPDLPFSRGPPCA